eukprot:g1798.t1
MERSSSDSFGIDDPLSLPADNFDSLPLQPDEFASAVSAIAANPTSTSGANSDMKGMFKNIFEERRKVSVEDIPVASVADVSTAPRKRKSRDSVESFTRGPSNSGRDGSKKKRKKSGRTTKNEVEGGSKGGKGEVGRRQARNRISAKRSRMRKESFMEALKQANRRLEAENRIVRQYLQSTTGQTLFLRSSDIDLKKPVDPSTISNFNSEGVCLVRSLATTEKSFILTDAMQPDNPITYASEQFYRLTGFSKEEVLGRNCRFLQGPLTNGRSVLRIREAVSKGNDCAVTLINYKKNGKPFWNQLFVFPLRDEKGCVVNYIGVQSEVMDEKEITRLDSEEK